MLNWWMTNQATSGGGPIKNIVDWDQSVFRVKNTTGRDLLSYDPVGLDGPIFDIDAGGLGALTNETSQKGVDPDATDHIGGKWGVMLECAGDGKIGRCCISGVVPLRVYVNATTDKFCDVIIPENVGGEGCYIGTGGSGAQILWLDPAAAATEIAWAIVRLGPAASGLTPAILKDDCAPDDTDIAAYPVASDGTADEDADELTLDNTHPGNFRGYGSDHTGFDTTTAAKVLYASINGKNQIVGGKGLAKMCYCQAKIASGNTLATVDNVVPMDGGHSPVASSSTELSVSSGFETDNNAYGIIAWDETNGVWRPLDFPCKTA
jgi:hypothetical protein